VLRTNLATRPFYNDRAVHAAIGAAAAVLLAITILNVVAIVTLSRRNTELSSRVNAQRAEAEHLTAEAARIRRSINKDELELVVNAAAEANALIDQRTFSWTQFFNVIESTLPPDVMLSAVRPSIVGGEPIPIGTEFERCVGALVSDLIQAARRENARRRSPGAG